MAKKLTHASPKLSHSAILQTDKLLPNEESIHQTLSEDEKHPWEIMNETLAT